MKYIKFNANLYKKGYIVIPNYIRYLFIHNQFIKISIKNIIFYSKVKNVVKNRPNPVFRFLIPIRIRAFLGLKYRDLIKLSITTTYNNKIVFSAFLNQSSEKYIVLSKNLTGFNNLSSQDILKVKIKNLELITKIRLKSSNLITFPKKYCKRLNLPSNQPFLVEIAKINPQKSTKSKLLILRRSYIDLMNLLPEKTDSNQYWYIIDEGDFFYAFFKSKHVQGNEIKYIKVPRLIQIKELGQFLGLLITDGNKRGTSFGFCNGDVNLHKLFIETVRNGFKWKTNFKGSLHYPKDLLNKEAKKNLKKYYNKKLKIDISISKSKPRKIWCPTGILNLYVNNIAKLYFVTSLLYGFKRTILDFPNSKGKDLIRYFLIGVLQGDGYPILNKGFLTRIMIATETLEESDFYKLLFEKMGIKAKNLWPTIKSNTYVKPYLRKTDVAPNNKNLAKLFLKKISFGNYSSGIFNGSIERELKFLCGLYKKTYMKEKLKSIEIKRKINKLDLKLRRYFIEIKLFNLLLPKHIEEYLNGRKELPIR